MKGLGVTVRRFKPPSSVAATLTVLQHAASTPNPATAAAAAAAAATDGDPSTGPVSPTPFQAVAPVACEPVNRSSMTSSNGGSSNNSSAHETANTFDAQLQAAQQQQQVVVPASHMPSGPTSLLLPAGGNSCAPAPDTDAGATAAAAAAAAVEPPITAATYYGSSCSNRRPSLRPLSVPDADGPPTTAAAAVVAGGGGGGCESLAHWQHNAAAATPTAAAAAAAHGSKGVTFASTVRQHSASTGNAAVDVPGINLTGQLYAFGLRRNSLPLNLQPGHMMSTQQQQQQQQQQVPSSAPYQSLHHQHAAGPPVTAAQPGVADTSQVQYTVAQSTPSPPAAATAEAAVAAGAGAQMLPVRSVQQFSSSAMESASDVFNDADIQQLLQRVNACVGPEGARSTAAGAAGTSAPAVQAAAASAVGACGSVYESGLRVHAASTVGQTGSTPFPNYQAPVQHQAAAAAADGVQSPAVLTQHRMLAAVPTPAAAAAAAAAAAVAVAGQQADGCAPSSPRRRQLQRHVSWKAEVNVLDGGDSSGSSAPCSPHPNAAHPAHAVAADAWWTATASPPPTAASAASAAAASSAAAAAEAGVPYPVYQSGFAGRAQADMAALLQQHPATAAGSGFRARLGSSCDGGQPRLALSQQDAVNHAAQGAGMHAAGAHAMPAQAAAAAVAADAPAIVVSLSSAALALAANLEQQQQQQQQQRRQSEDVREITLSGGRAQAHQQQRGRHSGVPTGAQGSLQHQDGLQPGLSTQFQGAQQVQGSVTGAGGDDASSCCGSSELSAMAHPVAYADTLRQRVAANLGSGPNRFSSGYSAASGVGTAAAAGVGAVGATELGSPSSAVNLLERYLDGHQALKQKAVRLEQNLREKKQLKQQRLGEQQQQQILHRPLRTFSPLGPSAAAHWQSGLAVPNLQHMTADRRQTKRLLAAKPDKQQAQLFGIKAAGQISSEQDDRCQLNVDELRQDLELVLRRV